MNDAAACLITVVQYNGAPTYVTEIVHEHELMYGDAGDAPPRRRLQRQRRLGPRRDRLPPDHVRDRIEAHQNPGSLFLCQRLELRGPEIGKVQITFFSEGRLPNLSSSNIRAPQLSVGEFRALQLSPHEVRALQLSVGEVRAPQLSVGEFRALQLSPHEVRALQLSVGEVRAPKVDLVGQRCRVEAAVLQVGEAQRSPPQVEAFQACDVAVRGFSLSRSEAGKDLGAGVDHH